MDWIRSRGLDYPTEGLEADRFDMGWTVYAPVTVDESDPMAFLDMPVGRSVFFVGDSGRIEEVSSSVPPQQAVDWFIAGELAAAPPAGGSDGAEFMAEFMAEFERQFRDEASDCPPISIIHSPPDTAEIAAEASRLITPIVQQLAQLGPRGWEWFSAEFAFTASAEVAQLRFSGAGRSRLVPVPDKVRELVRGQRRVAARMPAGPWLRLRLTVTNRGETAVNYDYGDEPSPDGPPNR